MATVTTDCQNGKLTITVILDEGEICENTNTQHLTPGGVAIPIVEPLDESPRTFIIDLIDDFPTSATTLVECRDSTGNTTTTQIENQVLYPKRLGINRQPK